MDYVGHNGLLWPAKGSLWWKPGPSWKIWGGQMVGNLPTPDPPPPPEWRLCLLVSTSHTKLLLRYCCCTLFTSCMQMAYCDSGHIPPSKFLESFTFILFGIVVIEVTVVVSILLVMVLNSSRTTSSSSINLVPFCQQNMPLIKFWKFQIDTVSHCYDIVDVSF